MPESSRRTQLYSGGTPIGELPTEVSVSPAHPGDSAEEADAAAPPRVGRPPRPADPRSSRWSLPLIGVALAFLVFELIPRVGLVDEAFFPPASAMIAALVEQIANGSLWGPLGDTLQGWALGLGLALVIGVPLGIAIGSVYLVFMGSRSILEFLRPVPSVALIPLAVLVFGAGLESKVFLAAFAATWPILLQTLYGVRDVDPTAMDTARSFGIGRAQRLWRVTLPSALPYVATGVRISSSVALILAVTAELVLGIDGLGQVINVARQSAAVENMYGLIIATGLLGWGLNALMTLLERRLLRWHPSVRGATR